MRLPTNPEATSCFRFDGSTSYISSTYKPAANSAFSIAFWVNINGNINTGRIVDWSDSGPVNGFSIMYSGDRRSAINVTTYNAAGSTGSFTSKDVGRDVWTHITVVFNGSTIALYKNGVSDNTPQASSGFTAAAANYVLGKRAVAATAYSRQLLYDYRHYSRALTAQEAQDLADGKDIDSTSLALRWVGNQNGGATVPDASGNGNTGTFTTPFYLRDSPFYPVRPNVGGNLIYNGDFEIYPKNDNVATTTTSRWIDGTASSASATERHAVGWALTNSGTATAQFDTTTKHSGAASLKLSTLATGSYIELREWAGTGSLSIYRNVVAKVQPSTSYDYSFWMKTNHVSGDATNGAYLSWIELDKAASTVVTTSTTPVKTTTDWTLYTGTITTSSTTVMMRVRPQIYGHQGTATLVMDAWFDDITLTETTPVTRNTATGRLAVRDMGTSLSFNGTSDKVSIGTAISPTTAITYSAWIKPTTPKASQRIIALFSHSSIRLDTNGRVAFVIHGIVEYFGTTRLNPNTWYHIAATYDRTNVKIYVNGVLESTTAETRAFPSTTTAGWIGTYDGATQFFAGKIDEPIIFNNRALSDADIGNLYQNGLIRGSTLMASLRGWWLFDEGSGLIAYDSSGNGNNGTITGATYSTDVACVGRSVA